MARVTIDDGILTSIADAIRTQYGESDKINPLDMAEAILGIEGGSGGGIEFPSNIQTFEVSFASQSRVFELNHGIGKKPYLVILVSVDDGVDTWWWKSMVYFDNSLYGYGSGNTSSYGTKNTKNVSFVCNEDIFTVDVTNSSYVYNVNFKGSYIALIVT